jgi:predicted histone-like DNA-binding protein
MIKYKKYQNKSKDSKVFGKWFGRAVHEIVEFDEFIEHMAKHHCVYSEGTLRGVLIEMEVCLRELLLDGKAVRMDDLGIFALSIANKKGGADKAEDYTPNMIDSVRMNLYLGKRFRAKQLYKDAKFREADKYVGDGNYYEPDADSENGASEQPSAGGGDRPGEGD